IDDASNQPLLQVVVNDAPAEVKLTDIKGIGPAIDRTLRENGVQSVAELLAMTDDDISAMSEHIKGLASKHPNWVAQARELLADQTTA
ncbi:MAG: helix-hairpin-helix domain-containing protein, partial [Pseudomonadota bacterium]